MRDYDYDSDNDSGESEGSKNVDRLVEYSREDLRRMAQEEPQRIQFERTNKDDSLDETSLDLYPEAYCLGDQALRARIRNFNNDWPKRYKNEYI